MGKTALITGVSGQDGFYLAKLLLGKGYAVHGIDRRPADARGVRFVECDLRDAERISTVVGDLKPDEIYNLAAQSSVSASFGIPAETCDVTALGPVRILEAIRHRSPGTRFYQAGSSEMFGLSEAPQGEGTSFRPMSPYAIAKAYAFWMARSYREVHGVFACNGIMFNHESPRRPEEYLTRKIAIGVAMIKAGEQDSLALGNLDARRDWGYAPDYVEAMWRMLQQDTPDDYVIATGETHTVREFCAEAFRRAGIPIAWSGKGTDEIGKDASGKVRVRVDEKFFRPIELHETRGDASKAKRVLGWQPKVTFEELVGMLVDAEMRK